MKLGVHYIDFLPGAPERLGPTLAATAKAAEDAGVEMFTLADHFFQMEGMGGPRTHSWRATRPWDTWPA